MSAYQQKVVIGDAVLYQGDCMSVLPTLGRFDCCLTSPPYNLGGFHQLDKQGRSAKWSYDDFADSMPESDYQAAQIEICNALFDVVDGPLFYSHKNRIVDGRLISPLQWMAKTQWVIHQQVIINKGSGANVDKRRFFPVHEVLLVCLKGANDRINNQECLTDVWSVEQVNRKDVQHPATMPPSVAMRALKAAGGRRVIEPYLGSGTTALAAISCGMQVVGIEQSAQYFAIACKRIEQAYAQGQLFAPEPKKQEQLSLAVSS